MSPSNPDEAEAVQQVVEQIDVTKRLIARYPQGLRYAETADEVESAIAEGKVASLAWHGGRPFDRFEPCRAAPASCARRPLHDPYP